MPLQWGVNTPQGFKSFDDPSVKEPRDAMMEQLNWMDSLAAPFQNAWGNIKDLPHTSPYEFFIDRPRRFWSEQLPRDTKAVGEDLWYNIFGAPRPAPEAPVPTAAPGAPPQNSVLAALSGAGGGAGLANFSFSGGKLPDTSRLKDVVDKLRGVKAPEQKIPDAPEFESSDMLNAILSGLSAGGAALPSSAPRSDLWWNLGMGALAGVAGERTKQRGAERSYKRERVELENKAEQDKLTNDMAILQALAGVEGGALDAEFKKGNLLRPSISGDTVLSPSAGADGAINYNIRQLPNQKARQMQLMMSTAMNDIPTLFQALALSSPAVLDDAAKNIGVDSQLLRGVGLGEKSVDLATQARIVNYIKTANPEAYSLLQREAAQMYILKALSK